MCLKITIILIVSFYSLNQCLAENNKIWALLLSTTDYWYDHAKTSDVLRAYQLLRSNDVPESNIVLFAEDVSFDTRNLLPGVLMHEPDGPNLLEGVTFDYSKTNKTSSNIYNVLAGNKTTGSKKVIESTSTDTIVIIISGVHGYYKNAIYMNYYDRVDTTKIISIIKDLKKQKRVKKVFIILDGSRTSNVFDEDDARETGIFILSSTGKSDYYRGCNYDTAMQVHQASCFSAAYLAYLEKISKLSKKEQRKFNMYDLYSNVQSYHEYNMTSVDIHGDLSEGRTPLYEIFGYQS